jgi:ribosomal protein S18 acetylase RimI-like enzyme
MPRTRCARAKRRDPLLEQSTPGQGRSGDRARRRDAVVARRGVVDDRSATPQPIRTSWPDPGSLRAFYRQTTLCESGALPGGADSRHPKEKHWYLMLLAPIPTVQRSGVGTMLLEHAFTHIDAEGVGVTSRRQKEDNVAYYQRFGYRTD